MDPNSSKNIHPTFEKIIGREEKEHFLKQKSKVLWLTGLSGSGKSTIAQLLEKELVRKGFFTVALDGDNIRSGINNNLGFSIEDRQENIRRIAEVAKLFLDNGVIAICSFISPTIKIRNFAKQIIGKNDFIEIYINAPLNICEKRDIKGLYKKARNGEIKNFTGISSPYETPQNPAIEIRTDKRSIKESVYLILEKITPLVIQPKTKNQKPKTS